MNENENSLRTLFVGAVEIPDGAERAAYLRRVCGDDDSLRQRLEKLLKAHAGAGELTGAEGVTNVVVPLTEKPGDRIGRYKLREQIGEGGCGVVYVAEQEEPIRRRVALKVIKLGMDTKSVIARFEAERQALAMMDHPNIARVLDAGATDTGRPYFVMELVRGIRITDYCDQNNLSTHQRLDLFNQVCRAIQHAHQKGIIHRDIKPSNILVTLHDGVPVPKVIDFGIAKATEGRLSDLTVYTELHQFIGTPAYMSPEQAEMSGLDIDTRSDIYSLGVLLYELLTGKTPFDAKELLQAGLDQMRRIIREQEPVKPSTRLSTLTHADLSEVARHRHVEAPKLIHAVRGDLDWIIMKALEKDRTRRYETANALAMDIERHQYHESVVARPPGNFYRFRKLVRRNKLAVAAAGAVLAALVVGLGLSTWLFVRERAALKTADRNASQAEKQAQRAEAEAARSRQVAEFMRGMLKGVGPSVALGRDTKMLREILDQTAGRISRDLPDQPGVEAELRSTIGNVYDDLGDYGKAGEMHRAALDIRRKLLGDEHRSVADSLQNLGLTLRAQGKLDEAEAMHREALAMNRKLLGNEHEFVADSLHNLGYVLWKQDRLEEAEALQREALAMMRKRLGNEHLSVAAALNNLASVLRAQDKLAEAEPFQRESLAMSRKLLGNEHPTVAAALTNLASMLRIQGNLTESETMQRESLAMKRKLLGNEHPDVAGSLQNLSNVLRDQDKLADAETMNREALAMWKKLLGNDHPDVLRSFDNLAKLLHARGKLTEIETLFREELAYARQSATNDAPRLEGRIYVLAGTLYRLRKFAEAEPLYRELLQSQRSRLPAEDDRTIATAASLGRLLSDWVWAERSANGKRQSPIPEPAARAREAERLLRDCLAARASQSSDSQIAESKSRLGGALVAVAVTDAALDRGARLAKLTEAEPLLLDGCEGVQQSERPNREYRRDALTRLVRLYDAWDELAPNTGRAARASEWKKKLAEFDMAEADNKTDAGKP